MTRRDRLTREGTEDVMRDRYGNPGPCAMTGCDQSALGFFCAACEPGWLASLECQSTPIGPRTIGAVRDYVRRVAGETPTAPTAVGLSAAKVRR